MICFSTIFLTNSLLNFEEYLTIASFRIGVPLILFFKVAVSKLAVVKLVLVKNLSDASSLTCALMKELP